MVSAEEEEEPEPDPALIEVLAGRLNPAIPLRAVVRMGDGAIDDADIGRLRRIAGEGAHASPPAAAANCMAGALRCVCLKVAGREKPATNRCAGPFFSSLWAEPSRVINQAVTRLAH